MSQALRKLVGAVAKSRTCVLFINQIRMKIGIMFGNPETTPGGNALKFYSSVRIDVRRVTTIKEAEGRRRQPHPRPRGEEQGRPRPSASPSSTSCSITASATRATLLDLAVEHGLIEKQGSWLSCGEVRLGQGREQAKKFLQDNPDLMEELHKAILAKGLPSVSDDAAPAGSPGAAGPASSPAGPAPEAAEAE